MLDRTQAVDQSHAEAPYCRGGLAGHAIEAGQPVGRQRHAERVQGPPALVARHELRIAEVEAETSPVDEDLGQSGGVAKAQIDPLAGDRVDRMGRVTD